MPFHVPTNANFALPRGACLVVFRQGLHMILKNTYKINDYPILQTKTYETQYY